MVGETWEALENIKAKILAAAAKDPIPIYVIAKNAGVCTTTASKYCYILQAENKITISSFGNMKLVRRVK